MRVLAILLACLLAPGTALAAEPAPSAPPAPKAIGLTVLGTPALAAGFKHFPYVNPDAPKGGEVVLGAIGSFDSFNPFVLRGTPAFGLGSAWVVMPGGSGSGSAIGHVWESLLVSPADEVATGYCHLCADVQVPADRMWVAFDLRPEAKFSDGVPVTAEDVAWTFNTLRDKGRPGFRIAFADVRDVQVEGPHRVVFHFKSNENRELPLILGGMAILPKHFFAGRDFTKPLVDAPVGSGPYKVGTFELGRSITYVRDPNWWARDLPTAVGTNNFDRVRIEYYRDATVALEAFKAGAIDVRSENIAKNWATAYDFPAVKDGRVIRQVIPHHLPTGFQGYAMNTRRDVFKDVRVRAAMAQLFDFQWENKNLFYGAYTRTLSYFSNSDLASSGLPDAAELKLLEPLRADIPPAVFTTPFSLPVTDGSGNMTAQFRAALTLLRQAGWTVKDRKLVNAAGQQMAFTILLDDPSLERPTLPYAQNLQRIGINVQVRTVDPAQYQHLTDAFDFDMTMMIYPEGDVPGNELRDYWSCAARDATGSSNVIGACNKAIDTLIGDVIDAGDRPALITAARALDRVMLNSWYAVPNWDSRTFRLAWWDKFGHPDKPTREGFNFDLWWVDAAKAKALAAGAR